MRYQLEINDKIDFPHIIIPVHAHKGDEEKILLVDVKALAKSIGFHILLILLVIIISKEFASKTIPPKPLEIEVVRITHAIQEQRIEELAEMLKDTPQEVAPVKPDPPKPALVEAKTVEPKMVMAPKAEPKVANEQKIEAIEPTKKYLDKYEQLIAAWLNKHKPAGLKGKNLALIRMLIDNKGQILSYSIEKSSGSPRVDTALLKMVRASNPLPKPPVNYEAEELMEFIIPVTP